MLVLLPLLLQVLVHSSSAILLLLLLLLLLLFLSLLFLEVLLVFEVQVLGFRGIVSLILCFKFWIPSVSRRCDPML